MLRKGIFIGFFCICLISPAYAGGGWVSKKGQGYYKLGFSWVENRGYYGSNGQFLNSLNTSLWTTSVYAEHGLGGGVSAEVFLPFYTSHTVQGSDAMGVVLDDKAGGIGDPIVGLRFDLLNKEYIAISGSVSLGLPFGQATLGKNGNLFTGDEEFNQLLKLNASVPFGTPSLSGFGTVYVGFNNRNDFFTDEFHYGIESGISLLKNQMWIIGRVNGIEAPSSPDLEMATNGFINSMSFVSYGVEVSFKTGKKTGISAGYQGLVEGNILLIAPTYNFGIYLDIK
jgi:protein XagA